MAALRATIGIVVRFGAIEEDVTALTTLDGSIGCLSATLSAGQSRRGLRHGPLADLCLKLCKTVSLVHLVEGLTNWVSTLHQNHLSAGNSRNSTTPGGYCMAPNE